MRTLLVLAVVLLSGFASAQPVLTEDAKLVGSGTDSLATAGWAIAAADGFVVLGAFRDDSTPTTGAAYVFRETADGWEEEAKLSASEQSFFTFGFSVGAWSDGREDMIIAGAPGDSFQPETDAAYIVRRSSDGEWVEEARLSNGPKAWEYFGGTAVEIDDDYAVIGALGADDFGEATGAAYVFRRTTEGVWVEDARLLASDAEGLMGFGRGVSIIRPGGGSPILLVGAPSDNDRRGAIYAFHRTADDTWVEEAKLTAPDSDSGDLFGLGVSLTETPDGETLALAGALGDRDAGLQSGAGYIFRREGDGSWVFEEKLTAADGQSGERLGWSVALAAAPEVGGTVAVLGGDGAYSFAGTVRLFRRTTGMSGPVWTEEAELWAGDRAPGDQLGYSVGASSRYAVAGAPNNDGEDSPAGRGAGYVWDLQRAVPIEPSAETSEPRVQLTAYPNPVDGGQATVHLRLPAAADVRIDAFDVLGREVAVLHDGPLPVGRHAFRLAAAALPSGVYLLRLRGDTASLTRRLIVLR